MNSILKFILLFMVLILNGCHALHQQDVRAQEIRSCQLVCKQQLSHCTSVCDDNCKSCEIKAAKTTDAHFKRYEHGRCLEGKTIARRLQSYHDPLQCRKMSCDCPADYRVCAQACTGTIHKRLQVEKTCC